MRQIVANPYNSMTNGKMHTVDLISIKYRRARSWSGNDKGWLRFLSPVIGSACLRSQLHIQVGVIQ